MNSPIEDSPNHSCGHICRSSRFTLPRQNSGPVASQLTESVPLRRTPRRPQAGTPSAFRLLNSGWVGATGFGLESFPDLHKAQLNFEQSFRCPGLRSHHTVTHPDDRREPE